MRLLVTSTNGVEKDGITSWIIQTFSSMDRTGLELVDTIAFEGADETLLGQLRSAGVRSHVLPPRKRNPIQYVRALRSLMKANAYDVVHINGNSGTAAIELICCLGAGVKGRIVHSHNTSSMYATYDKLLRPAMAALCTDRFACGQAAGEWLFGQRQFTVIPNGRDFDEYSFSPQSRDKVRQQLGLSNHHIAVGHVGYFNEQKNHRFLVEAFAAALKCNPRLRLFLLGDGTLRKKIEEQVSNLGLQQEIAFLGHRPRVSEYLSAFDIAVLPSLHEGFPNVAIEWQINGLPSLISTTVTKECSVTDLVRFVPSADTSAWAHAIASARSVDRANASRVAKEQLTQAGYEASESAAKLYAIYERINQR